jgi:hypothetical protein
VRAARAARGARARAHTHTSRRARVRGAARGRRACTQMMKAQTTTWPAHKMAQKPASSASVDSVRVLKERQRVASGCSASSSTGCCGRAWRPSVGAAARPGVAPTAAAAAAVASRVLARAPAGLPPRGLAAPLPPPPSEARPRRRAGAAVAGGIGAGGRRDADQARVARRPPCRRLRLGSTLCGAWSGGGAGGARWPHAAQVALLLTWT